MKYTNKYNMPQSFVDLIEAITYDSSKRDPMRIGVTTLTGPPRIKILETRHWNELEEDVSNHIWRILGNAGHYILSKTSDLNRLVEEKLTETIDGITIVGKLDLYEDNTKSIEDIKFTSVWNVKFGDRESWETQLNAYAYLLRKSGFEVKGGKIHAFLKDWRKGEKVRYGRDYPPIPYKEIKIKIWPFKKQEKYIKERVDIYRSVLSLTDDELPICSPKERWKKEDKWAVYEKGKKKALRVLNSEKEAKHFIEKTPKIKNPKIEFRKGNDDKCLNYCIVKNFCKYYKETYLNNVKNNLPKL